MTPEEIEAVIEETKALRAYQEEEETEEALLTIPLLKMEDLRKTPEPFVYEEKKAGDVPVLFHEIFTGGIVYLIFSFDLDHLPDDLVDDLVLFKAALGMMDTEHYSYAQLSNEIFLKTGGFGAVINHYPNAEDPEEVKFRFEVTVKVLGENRAEAFRLAQEILMTTKWEDEKRLKEIVDELKAQMSTGIASAGASSAAIRALSKFSKRAALQERVLGISALRRLEEMSAQLQEGKGAEISKRLREIASVLFHRKGLLVSLTGNTKAYEGVEEEIISFAGALHETPARTGEIVFGDKPLKEAFKTGGQVQFVCRAGNFRKKGYPYTGALRALKIILGYDYLWNNIRIKGGAYGCMSSFGRSGDVYFASYRDPHIKQTVEVFEKTPEHIAQLELDDRAILKSIIGALSELDMPKTPSIKGVYGLHAYMTGLTMEMLQKERDELMGIDEAAIRALSVYADAFLSDESLTVIGSAPKVEEAETMFDHVEQLIKG